MTKLAKVQVTRLTRLVGRELNGFSEPSSPTFSILSMLPGRDKQL